MKDIASSRAEKKAKQVTRREFLRQSLVAGAAVGAGLRSFSVSSYKRIAGANNDIRVAVVGHRIKGADHIEVFRNLPGVRVVAVEPADSPVLSGGAKGPHPIQGIGAGFVPDVLNTQIYDEIITVSGPDAFATARRM
ncbi:hypothetical protein DWB58_19830, partial [candidate division KSB1 bacterium]|nr:hypothetical protein [candidate division KSB1 bacterium]